MYEFAVTPAVTQLRRPGVLITEVVEASLGQELELESGDRIVRVNGRVVRDYLDFRFQTAGETELDLTVKKLNGETWELEIERDEGEDFGLEFEQIAPRQCANECLFCFCKGNPETARPSLFVRDEDIRLSFLYGNYTTLTSITPDEMNRIVEQRLSPQYVSVHATDLKVRAYLLGVDERRADISGKLKRLLDNDIEIHAQIVLCPEINDRSVLQKTVRDLSEHFPKISSVAIVPLGLTRYNTDARLTAVTPEFCRRTISEIEPLQREFQQNFGETFAFLGDEIYLKAGLPIPSRKHYGNYPQIEDGIGMVRAFVNKFENLRRKLRAKPLAPERAARINGTIFTGEMFAPAMTKIIGKTNSETGTRLSVVAVKNEYFGGDVAVAGLLTAGDFLRVKNKVKGDFAVLPSHVLKSDESIFLDGVKFEEFQREFGATVHLLDAAGLINMIENADTNTPHTMNFDVFNPRNRFAAAHPQNA
jgi:putative radical SAM enzyme (TIGR03279 family)